MKESIPSGAPAQFNRWVLPLCLAVILPYMLLLWNSSFQVGDEGVALMGGWRISQGQVPHGDFFAIVPPFSFLMTAGVFHLFGVSILSGRLLVIVYGLLLVIGVDRLLFRYTNDTWVRIMTSAFLIPFGVFYWPLPSHHWLVIILQLFSLICLDKAYSSQTPWTWGILSGVLASLGCFSMQDQGGYLVLGLIIAFFPWIKERGLRNRLFFGWSGGGVLASLAFAVYLFPRVSIQQLWYQLVVFPLTRYGEVSGNRGGLFFGWRDILPTWEAFRSHFIYHLCLIPLNILLFLLPPIAIVVLALAYRKKWRPCARVGLLTAGTIAAIGGCAHRWSIVNLAWAAPLLMVLLALGLSQARLSGQIQIRRTSTILVILLTVLSLLLAGSHLVAQSPKNSSIIQSRGGTIRSTDHQKAKTVQEVISAVEAHTPEDAPLVVTSFVPLVSFMTQRPNPTRFDFLVHPEYHTDRQAAEVIHSLKASTQTYVLMGRGARLDSALDRYIMSHYRPVWRLKDLTLAAPIPQEPRPSIAGGREPSKNAVELGDFSDE